MKYLIVGTGWAGLQAACLLKNKYHFEIDIVDMQERIGGTWSAGYVGLGTHAPRMTCEFFGYPNKYVGEYERVPADIMCKYMTDYARDMKIEENIRFLTMVEKLNQINANEVEAHLKDLKTGTVTVETYNMVMYTGFGSVSRELPPLPGKESFQGKIYGCLEVKQKELEEIKASGKTVTILGGSKSAYDLVYQMRKNDIKVRWIARKTYWVIGYDRVIRTPTQLGPRKERMKTLFGNGLYSYFPKRGLKYMIKNRVLLNAHPESAQDELYAMHGAVVDNDMMETVKQAEYMQGEIVRFKTNQIVIQNKKDNDSEEKELDCDILILALGTHMAPVYPLIERNGEVVDPTTLKQLFQISIDPRVPRIYFAQGPLKGFGMLSGYHSVQHMLILLCKQYSEAEMNIMLEKETKMVEKHLAKSNKPVVPQLLRSLTDGGNFSSSFEMNDSILAKSGYASKSKRALYGLLVAPFYHVNIKKPAYRDPTKKELTKYFGKEFADNVEYKGHGILQKK